MAAEEEEKQVPDSGAIFTFGKSKFEENRPSRFWLKNDKPAHISCGDEHSVLVTGNGKLFVFGSNIYGQLGIGSGNVISKPTCVKALKSEKVKLTACGRNHTLICTVQGKVYSTGWNSEGQLGLGDTKERASFHEIAFFNSQPSKIRQLSAGSNTSAVLTADGKLFMWGENSEGQLGIGDEKTVCSPHQVDIGKPISWVSCGYYHSAFVTQDGELYTFGEPENGKLGLPVEKLDKHRQPQRVPGISGKVKMVSCGGGHTIAVTDREVYTFGHGQFGQLGHGTILSETPTPKVVEALKPHKVRYVACGENHSAVITDKGLLYTFGDGRYGKLGLGEENFTNQFSPTLCMNFLKFNVQSVACGGCHMLVFATPRPKESETVIVEELKENYLMVNGDGERSTTLQRSPSARVRRREKKQTSDQIRDLTRTLPPLNVRLLDSSLPVPSKTLPPGLKVRQASTESSANDVSAESKSEEKRQKDMVKSFSADDDSDNVSRRSFGATTDILNITHVISATNGGSTFSPVQKRKEEQQHDESEEEEDEEDEEEASDEEEDEEDEEEVEEDDENDANKGNNDSVSNKDRTESPVKTPEEVTKVAEQTVSSSVAASEPENPQAINEVQSSENEVTKSTLLEKTRRLSLFKKRSTTSQKSLQGNGSMADTAKEIGTEKTKQAEKTKDSKDENRNTKQEDAIITEQPHQENTESGQTMQDKRLKPTTCVLL